MSRIGANLATAITFGFIMVLLGLVGIWQAVHYASVQRERGNCAFAVFLLARARFRSRTDMCLSSRSRSLQRIQHYE